jgi:anti-anti-sigma factor
MMVRITRTEQEGTTVLQVEGSLSAVFVDEMARECESVNGPFVLDLVNLRYVDSAGAALLAQLAATAAELRGVSPYIAIRMEQYAAPATSLSTSFV